MEPVISTLAVGDRFVNQYGGTLEIFRIFCQWNRESSRWESICEIDIQGGSSPGQKLIPAWELVKALRQYERVPFFAAQVYQGVDLVQEAKFTPVPWTISRDVDNSPGNYGVTRHVGPAYISNDYPAGTPEGDRADADLYLIGAAPLLAAAIQANEEYLDAVRISQAEGGSEKLMSNVELDRRYREWRSKTRLALSQLVVPHFSDGF